MMSINYDIHNFFYSFLSLISLTLVVVLGSCNLYYGNLIANCGFENGVLSPWVHTTPSFQHSWAISTNSPYLGNYVATTGAIVVGDTLVTVVPTVPNAKYVVSFNFRNTGTPNQTWLTFGGVRILSLVDSNYPSWVVRTLESYTSLYLSIHPSIYLPIYRY
jgi:hypothetical protein